MLNPGILSLALGYTSLGGTFMDVSNKNTTAGYTLNLGNDGKGGDMYAHQVHSGLSIARGKKYRIIMGGRASFERYTNSVVYSNSYATLSPEVMVRFWVPVRTSIFSRDHICLISGVQFGKFFKTLTGRRNGASDSGFSDIASFNIGVQIRLR